MNEINEHNEEQEALQNNNRPQLLSVFLILSMINGAVSSISNFILYGMVDSLKEIFGDSDTMNFMGMELDISLFTGIDKKFFLYQGLLFAVSFTGALLMWNYKKAGFHLYVLSQILLLIVSTIFLPGMPFPYMDILLTGLFVYVYAKNLSLME